MNSMNSSLVVFSPNCSWTFVLLSSLKLSIDIWVPSGPTFSCLLLIRPSKNVFILLSKFPRPIELDASMRIKRSFLQSSEKYYIIIREYSWRTYNGKLICRIVSTLKCNRRFENHRCLSSAINLSRTENVFSLHTKTRYWYWYDFP